MVCLGCNGKGYVVEKGREVVCMECQGRGEYIPFAVAAPPKQESRPPA
jgi:DnaJ-class molecular chaperone